MKWKKEPFNEFLKKESCEVLTDYCEAIKDEERLLYQKAKVEWLKEGDKNTNFFHKVLKGRKHRGRIMSVCDEKGNKFENEEVLE